MHLEMCYDQFHSLEKERKKVCSLFFSRSVAACCFFSCPVASKQGVGSRPIPEKKLLSVTPGQNTERKDGNLARLYVTLRNKRCSKGRDKPTPRALWRKKGSGIIQCVLRKWAVTQTSLTSAHCKILP